jgi:FtsP/CotA-like multicopper oxidase with cupredoxin domain
MHSVLDKTAQLLAFIVLVGGFGLSLAESQEGEPEAEPDVRVEIQIVNREVVGEQLIRVTQGQIVEMTWTTDEETQVHIHGYEIHIPASPGTPAKVTFEARATGRFPVTSHGYGDDYGLMHQMLLYFEVYPD